MGVKVTKKLCIKAPADTKNPIVVGHDGVMFGGIFNGLYYKAESGL